MKLNKKFIALLLAIVMVFSFATAVSAANITIEGGATGSEYSAYRLLNVTDGGDGKFAYTVNETYKTALQSVTGKATDAEIVKYIDDMKDDATAIRTFADAVYARVKDMTADATTKTDVFTGVAQGYYLIVETKTGSWGEGTPDDTYSLVMLDTAGKTDITVNTKEDRPELEKKVQEKNDSTGNTSGWQDGADYDIGDAVPFKLTGTVSAKYADYETYYYAFHDKMSAGLTFDKDSVVVKIDDTEIDASNYDVVFPATDGCTFDVVFEDLKTIVDSEGEPIVTATSKITVEFTATLNDGAVIGIGNPNEAKLEYSNNPYGDGKGKTPWDKVVVFTYELISNKVDVDGNAVAGAGFTLFKFDYVADDWVAVGTEITGKTTFTWTGLDAGQYKLVETTVPDGYNKADDVIFTVEAVYDTDSADPQLTDLVIKDANGNKISVGNDAKFAIDLGNGTASTNIVNTTGPELPSTGGIGTTIFYVLGSVLLVGAAVLLVVRRRMRTEK